MPRVSFASLLAFGLALPLAAQFGRGPAGPQRTTTPPELQFHYMGPATGGRVASAAGVPGDPTTYYLGSASGGLWKSVDGGHTFAPIFDSQDAAAIGTIAVAPSDPNTVWVGTGEPWVIRPADIIGDGVYVSHDAGKTWEHRGLVDSGRIARIVINPKDANNLLVCVEGQLTHPQQDRGVYRTTDGGASWTKTLFVNPETGCSGLSMDPNDPSTVFAGTWQVTQRTWDEASGGPGSGVYVSHDNGQTWKHLTEGLPHSPLGKIDVALAPSNPKRVYALIQTKDQGSLWRSDDGGESWHTESWDRSLIGRAGYYINILVNPQNADDVLITSSSFHRSTDGGKDFSGNGGAIRQPGAASCGDCHDMWMDPTDPARYVLTDDGGASIATGAGNSLHVSLPNGQTYHVLSDNQVPYWIYSNRQDDGTMRIVSTVSQNSGNGMLPVGEFMPEGGGFGRGFFGRGRGQGSVDQTKLAAYPKEQKPPAGLAFGPNDLTAPPSGGGNGFGAPREAARTYQAEIGGCESGFTVPDPTDPNIIWATCYGNKLTRYDDREGTAHSVEPNMISLDSPPNQTKYRCHWTAPLIIDPYNHNNVFYGCQMVLRTNDKGHSWTEFSPDLSTKDPSRVVSNGGIEGDNLAQYDGEVVWSMAMSPIEKGLMWAGTNDGKLWYTKDAENPGQPHWTDVTANLHLPPWGEINQISPSSFDPATAYIAVDFRMAGQGDFKPYMFKTSDYGQTWHSVNGDIPSSNPLDYILTVAENPNRKGMLFAGSAHAFYYSLDDGAHWVHFNKGLPPSPVSWINVEKRFHDVDVSTYGRGLYILPDISTLEQTGSTEPPAGETKLFKPGPVFRKARSAFPTAAQPARPQFQFVLGAEPKGPVQMEILDAAGKEVRKMELTAHAGLNGAYWDLLYDAPKLVELRTTPPENPHIWEEPRFQGKEIRTITHWGITGTTGIPMAAPGNYQVKLTVDGQSYTQPFEVLKDPAVEASSDVLRASTAAQLRARADITETSTMVNTMEKWRKQIEDALKTDSPATGAELKALDGNILKVERTLVSEDSVLSDDKYFPSAYKVYMNLIWLSGGLGQGASDEAGGLDYAPTTQQLATLARLEAEIATAKAGFNALKATTIPAFNARMKGKAPAIAVE